MSRDEAEAKVSAIVEEFVLELGRDATGLDGSVRLLGEGFLDSLEVIELIVVIETELGIEFVDTELSLDRLEDLTATVLEKLEIR